MSRPIEMRAFARRGLWPLFVSALALVLVAGFAAGHGPATLVTAPLLGLAVLLRLEVLLPAADAPPPWRDPQLANDVGHTVLGQVLGNELGRVSFLLVAGAIAGAISERLGGNLWPVAWPVWLQVLCLLAVADAMDYWRHRLLHEVSWLWLVHALHHDTRQLHSLKSGRSHPLDMLLRSLVVYAPLVAMGVPGDVLLSYPAAVTVLGLIGHANVDVNIPSFVHRILLTPQGHRIHHAGDLEVARHNYANVFASWDVLFGTFRHPDDCPRPVFGGVDESMPGTFTGQLLAPFASGRRALRA